MSEAIIARGGKGIGQQINLSEINASLLSINTKINQIDSNVNSLWDTVNDIGNGALDTAINAFIATNGYYNCTKTGNYWIELCGGGGGGGASNENYEPGDGGKRGTINNRSIFLNKGESIYVYIGSGGNAASTWRYDGNTGGTSSFGSYLSASGGLGGDSIGRTDSPYSGFPEYMYYNSSNNRRLSASGSQRAYYGDGGKGNWGSQQRDNGNSGCCIITYID